ncbi:endonuclease/exonuclease/phosphatase [Myxococcus stipitatus DSM 14675]|uniref:Endonuclease/exonuclease/phosphatase n=1 Tax=Myxococcus stipitatus (strain DSM 14675 / JCM 12634 / Mx s8) TaxID=1278073 RepID=L7UMJ1_MYXSD|nr:putative Ig domain-containing protein [Myxococcus stipitatus]AGC49100.1 endonuclease/exonuclease/phosphatase [Myxococcus stipitatus DSM 14675]
MRFRRALTLLLVLCLSACSGTQPPSLPDSGTPPADGGDTPLAVTPSVLADAYLGDTYAAHLEATGGTPPYAWSLASGALPPGLQLSAQGLLSGAPTVTGSFTLSLRVRDASGGEATQSLALSSFTAPTLSTATPSLGVVGAAYSFAFSLSGGRAPLTLRVASGALPSGLRLEATSLAGTPTAHGTSSFTLEARDANGRTVSAPFQLTVREGLTITTATLPDAYTDRAYGQALSAAGGQAPHTWSLVSGALPPGLSLLGTGVLDGTPASAGTTSFTVRVADALGASDTREVTLVTFLPPSLGALAPLSAYVRDNVTRPLNVSHGGKGPFVFSASGVLPPGLTLASAGLLHGQPTQAGVFTFDVIALDANERVASSPLTVTITALPAITTLSLPDGTRGSVYSHDLAVTGGAGTRTWAIASGALPVGLSLSAQGTLSGTPTSTGLTSFSVRISDGNGRTDSRALSLEVSAPLTVTNVPEDGYATTPYSSTLTASGGRLPLAWSIASGTLPSGLALASDTGVISGTLGGQTSTSALTLRVTDSRGRIHLRDVSLQVYALPVVTGPSTSLEAYVGIAVSESYGVTGGKAPYVFATTSALPSGLVLSTEGRLSGSPTAPGTSSTQVRVTDANGRTAFRTLAFTIYESPSVTTTVLPEAQRGEPYSTTLALSGGKAPFAWSLTRGALPSGLLLSSEGVISGTPTTVGTTSFDVAVEDASGTTATRTLELTIKEPAALFTVGHWNIEWFGADANGPPDGPQLAHARDILNASGANVWGLVEMVDNAEFDTLKSQLGAYQGFLANDSAYVSNAGTWYSSNEQKPGILYDSSLTLEGASLILTEHAGLFAGRPPLRVDFTTTIHGAATPLVVIVLHMKAFDDETSYNRRRDASLELKKYLDTMPDTHVFVIGDWNDDVDRSISRVGGVYRPTPYENFLSDSLHYTFITRALSERGEPTTTGYPDAIDHTLASDELAADYVSDSVRTLRPDVELPDYADAVSDHYPVISRYDFGGSAAH